MHFIYFDAWHRIQRITTTMRGFGGKYNTLVFCAFFLLSGSAARAQYANDWVRPGQQYYKISVAREGIYRLTHADLQNAGFPTAAVDPRTLQLFHRGEEQAIAVQGEQDAVFDPADFIEFYGQRNDGTLDAALYQPPAAQPHAFHNLYSDTTAYFLTWSLGQPGKRMSTFSEVNVDNVPKDSHHLNQRLSVFTNEYSPGNTLSGVIRLSSFDTGEGWTGTTICVGNTGCTGQQDFLIENINNTVPAAGLPLAEVLLAGRDALNHQTQIFVGPSAGSLRLVGTQNFVNFDTHKTIVALAWSDVGSDGRLVVRVVAQGVGGGRDRVSVSYIKLTFPQAYQAASLTEKAFYTAPNSANKSYIEWENAPANTRVWDVTNPSFVYRIGTQGTTTLTAMVPNTIFTRKLWVANTVVNTPPIKRVSFRNLETFTASYLVVTHRLLKDAARAYAGYRASPEGGSYDTLVVTVDEVFNQFNFGEASARGVYELVRWASGTGSPRYLFLIGKGRDVTAGFYRKTTLAPGELPELVPTAGTPGSDMLFSAQLNGSGNVPFVPTGRLSAVNPSQVIAYLNKVREHEAQPLGQEWRKQGLHLSGGIEPGELTQFRQFMDGFKGVAENEFWGGRISTVAKREPNPVELINVSEKVNEGVNLITFFGHSSTATIDIDIGFASNPTLGYNNAGKYPVFLVNGCNAGNFFSPGTLFGEDWMHTASKGARAFIAHSSFGFSSTLRSYTDLFYRVGMADSVFLRKGIGDVQKEVARRYFQLYSEDMISVTQVQQMLLLGDPVVSFFGTNRPDYAVDGTGIFIESTDNEPVTAQTDSLRVRAIVRNVGAFRDGLLTVRLVRTLGNGQTLVYEQLAPAVLFSDTLHFKIPNDPQTGGGTNQFTIVIDPANAITELSKENNTATINFFLPSNGTRNLFPHDHAIVQNNTILLTWQITNALSDTRSFDLQVDTTRQFNSPFLQTHRVSGKVIAKHTLALLPRDSSVYYWRTRINNPLPDESTEWDLNAFVFIQNGEEGWGQIAFEQGYDNALTGLQPNEAARQLTYLEKIATLFVRTYGSANPTPRSNVSVKIDNIEYNLATQGQPCRDNTINLMAFSRTSLVPYPGLPFNFQDPRTCGREPQVINSFTLAEVQTGNGDDLAAAIDNLVAGDSVVLFSIGDAGYASWNAATRAKLAQLGISSAQLAALQAGEPVVIMGRKGALPASAQVYRAGSSPPNQQELAVNETITASNTSGTIKTARIGPASAWQSLTWRAAQITAEDNFRVNIYGSSLQGAEKRLVANASPFTDLSNINALTYPYLRLEFFTEDEVNLTPAQLDQWIVSYTGVPEGILLPAAVEAPFTVNEGEAWSSRYLFENISARAFSDSLTVRTELFNNRTRTVLTNSQKIKAPLPGTATEFAVTTPTVGMDGTNRLTVTANPFVLPEQYFENNTMVRNDFVTVRGDETPPVLRVRVDGRLLLNGDEVSRNPLIEIELTDGNPFLLKQDTLGLSMLLKYPCATADCPFEPVYFARPDVTWLAATVSSPFLVFFRPQNLAVGEYVLRVNGEDAVGNKAGEEAYEVSFVVREEATVRFQGVSPNPSSALFFFEVDISGERPDDGTLEIIQSDGRAVFSALLRDQLHVGLNRFSWDGARADGSPVSSGLYVYRLRVNQQGKMYTATGRLVLVR